MGYISNIRKKVGHEPLIGVGATILIFNEKNELLLNLRSNTRNWGIPGGLKELNETIEECAIREVKEETNLALYDLNLLAVLSGEEFYFKYPNNDELDCVITLFEARNYEGTLKINDNESTELKFFSLDNLPQLEARAKIIIDKIINGQIKIQAKINSK